jgi:hypothetical protein
MAIHPPLDGTAALRGPHGATGPSLRLLPPVAPSAEAWKREEAHIEAIAFMDEVAQSCEAIVTAIALLPIPSMLAIQEAGRIAVRAELAKRQILDLLGPEPDAA